MASGRIQALGYDRPGMPFFTAVGLGMVPGCTRVTGLGHNPSIDIATAPEDVWEGGGLYPFQAAASVLEVLSASANDTAAGTGARTVLVSGLDANYNPISETVALNGVTPVQTVRSYLRVNTFTTVTSGSGLANAGDITLRVTGGGTTLSIMRASYGFARSAVYSVPAGFTLFVLSEVFTVFTAGGAAVNGAVFGGVLRAQSGNSRIPLEFQITSQGPYRHDISEGVILAEKSDFVIRVTSVGQNSTNVTAAFEALQVDNLLIN